MATRKDIELLIRLLPGHITWELNSYRPGKHRLYSLHRINGDGSATKISPYLRANNMYDWLDGYTTARP